ncbi:hypothetical protein [Lactobacillus sp. ESL0230]|uniref:hypothetical protein n=1 Tax=Lactobacillus sp. ESL0230 TaxID=2069353 RepID=UPI0013149534|nr:hypothetical protein [Lactobacillus sp. ESL0230]
MFNNLWNNLSSNIWPITGAMLNLWGLTEILKWILIVIRAVLKATVEVLEDAKN